MTEKNNQVKKNRSFTSFMFILGCLWCCGFGGMMLLANTCNSPAKLDSNGCKDSLSVKFSLAKDEEGVLLTGKVHSLDLRDKNGSIVSAEVVHHKDLYMKYVTDVCLRDITTYRVGYPGASSSAVFPVHSITQIFVSLPEEDDQSH